MDMSRLLAASAVLFALLACRPSKPYTRSSETASAPAGSPWQRATAKVDYHPRRSGSHSTASARIDLSLVLEGAAGTRILKLDDYLGSGTLKPGPGDTSTATFQQMLKPDLELRFAPDGRSLALSVDDGDTFRLVSFETDDPLYCTHVAFSLESGWSAAPKPRELVLEILASADPPVGSGRLHLEPGEHPRGRGRFEREFHVARDYACNRLDDAKLSLAIVAALSA